MDDLVACANPASCNIGGWRTRRTLNDLGCRIPFVSIGEVPEAAEGVITAVHALHTTMDLNHESQEGPNQGPNQ